MKNNLCAALPWADFHILDETESTNNIARALATEGAREYTCILSRRQTGGRGRKGRSFFSYDGGIYISLILRPDITPQQSLFITVAAASAAAEAIGEFSGKNALIKWVNDIYIDGKKVCGILTEGNIVENRLDFAVLGIGINLFGKKNLFPDDIKDIAGYIVEGEPNDREKCRLITLFMQKFSAYYEKLEDKEYLKTYRERNFLKGKEIAFEREGKTLFGTVVDINDDAALIACCEGKRLTLTYGDVTIRKF